jgi:hypothetical protein
MIGQSVFSCIVYEVNQLREAYTDPTNSTDYITNEVCAEMSRCHLIKSFG